MVFDLEWAQNRAQAEATPNLAFFSISSLPFVVTDNGYRPDGQPRIDWLGNVPMRWRDQEVVPLAQTVGAAKDADFLMVQRTEGKVSLMPLLVPNNLRAQRTGGCRFVARLQARSEQVDSDVLRIQVAWDGVWEDGDTEMQMHLVVAPAAS